MFLSNWGLRAHSTLAKVCALVATMALMALMLAACSQFEPRDKRFYYRALWNFSLREDLAELDSEFNGVDFGHSNLYENLLLTGGKDMPAIEAKARKQTLAFIASKPRLNPNEEAIAPTYMKLAGRAQNTFDEAHALRRKNPRIIPEAYALANLVMNQLPFRPDFIVDEDSAPYPGGGNYTIEQLQAEGYPALLRIERGRVRNREIFGPMRLDYGCFKLQARRTSYFLARSGGHIVGAVGYTMDPVEHTVRVFELIALADDVVRFLLVELERMCRDEMGIEYIEIDVSAYAPRMQRTLLELNFLPVAYVPAMVFYHVERLDIVKMVRLNKLQDLGPLALVEPVQALADVVMRGFSSCVIAPRMAQAIKEIPLFQGMNNEQAIRLAGACTVREVRAGERLFAEHDPADRLYIVLQGQVVISGGTPPVTIGTVHTGETCGEVSLLSARPHSATATAEGRMEAAELLQGDLADLIRRRPDIGVIIYRNLAVGLGDKLLRSSNSRRDRGLVESAVLHLASEATPATK